MHLTVINGGANDVVGAQVPLGPDATPEDLARALRKLRRLYGDDAQFALVGAKPAN